MKNLQKILELRNIIDQKLTPTINSDYVLWGLPYHSNIGDVLIWQGELDFLKKIPYKCKGVCSWNSFPGSKMSPRKVKLKDNITILLHGGGYLGDTWREGWKYVLEGIRQYPNNPIVLLPQTIYYNDLNLLEEDVKILKTIKKLTICVRDNVSYNFAQKYFGSFSNVIKMPDMAFHIDLEMLQNWKKQPQNKKLYLKRQDKEHIGTSPVEKDPNVEIRDWPTMEKNFNKFSFNIHNKIMYYRSRFEQRFPKISIFTSFLADWELYKFFRPEIIKIGVEFITSYTTIRTTRLHVLILSVLLEKEVVSEDNSYGKLSSFYETWLSDLDNVSIEKI